jgi:hypothetical protein
MAQATAHFVQRHVGWGGGVMPAILMYHSISPYSSDPYQITVSPARFGLVGLTFDDGYSDFMHYALPVLAFVAGLIAVSRFERKQE